MKNEINIFWFRRDLRLEDNTALYFALKSNIPVLCVFIFDKNILTHLENKNDRRLVFIHNQLQNIKTKLISLGSDLLILHNTPFDAFQYILKNYNIVSVFANKDYEPYAKKRDYEISNVLQSNQIQINFYKDQVIFEENEIIKTNGLPYTIFTPYSKVWKKILEPKHINSLDCESYFNNFIKIRNLHFYTLEELGFNDIKYIFPIATIQDSKLEKYEEHRDIPYIDGTSKLSIHLRFGTISIRWLVAKVLHNEKYLTELVWREFYMSILFHFPHVAEKAFNKKFENIAWSTNYEIFELWCKGQTGVPIIDAGMRELNETGFMHNRVRMLTANYLSKILFLPWQWGEAYFAKQLNDFELASNNGGWQWSAGCGCDAAPYFRIFNPEIQTLKFDPQHYYIKKWVPEYKTPDYPKPNIEYKSAKEYFLKTMNFEIYNKI